MKPIRNNQILRAGLICFLLFFASYLFATEYDVAGRVINNQKDPIKNAVVTLSDLKTNIPVATTLCNANGYFNFCNVPEGEYIIIVRKENTCRAKVKKLTVYSDGTVVTKNIENSDKEMFAIR